MARWRARGQREVREWKDSARAHLNECSCSEKCTILSSCLGYGPVGEWGCAGGGFATPSRGQVVPKG